jgi:hypothetical protein
VQKHREEIIADLDTLAEDMLRAFFKVRFTAAQDGPERSRTVQSGLQLSSGVPGLVRAALKCACAPKATGGVKPSRVVFYRDGVSEGQFAHGPGRPGESTLLHVLSHTTLHINKNREA